MATHRITLTTVGNGISATLDLYRWNGSAWVLHKTGIAKTALVAGYEFEDLTGATQFQLRDKGTCGTTLDLECTGIPPTTTLEVTTTSVATTEAPTTTVTPTTTALPFETFQVRLSDVALDHCIEAFDTVYVGDGLTITTGVTVYSDTALTTPVSGNYISEQGAGVIYNIAVGLIGVATGSNC